MKLIQTKDYLLLIDEKAEIKEGSKWVYDKDSPSITPILGNTIIVKEGIKKGWFVKIIAYYPLSKEAKELDLPLLPNPFEEGVLYIKYQAETYYEELYDSGAVKPHEKSWIESIYQEIFKRGYKAATKQFSLEDVKKAIRIARTGYGYDGDIDIEAHLDMGGIDNYNNEFKLKTEEEIIQSLSTQQLPEGFIPEYETPYSDGFAGDRVRRFYGKPVLKTIINSEGREELVGTYKY